tara:strand:+ start:7570 stop:8889 length:1320 start_codon:yes stop_codon:yes gene_type:complete
MATERERLLDAGAPVVEASTSGRLLDDRGRDRFRVATRVVAASVILGAAAALAVIVASPSSVPALGGRNSVRRLDDLSMSASDATRSRVDVDVATETATAGLGTPAEEASTSESSETDSANLGSLSLPLETAGDPNEWGTRRNALPWWSQPGAANAVAFPESLEGLQLDAHLTGRLGWYAEDGAGNENENDSEGSTIAGLGATMPLDSDVRADATSGSLLDVNSREGVKRDARIDARRRRRRQQREVADARTRAKAERDSGEDSGEEVDVIEQMEQVEEVEQAEQVEQVEQVEVTRSSSEASEPLHENQNKNQGQRDHNGKGPLPDTEAIADIEKSEQEMAVRVAARVAARAADGESESDEAETSDSKPAQALLGSENQFETEQTRAGFIPLLVEASVPLNPFTELNAQQHNEMANVYRSKGWEGMRAEAAKRTDGRGG